MSPPSDMTTLAARLGTEWRAFTPLHELTIERARAVTSGEGGPFAGAIVGVYGSGKSTLVFTLLREALASGAFALWDEAAPFVERLLAPGGVEAQPGSAATGGAATDRVLPQELAARVLDWAGALRSDPAALARHVGELRRRGHAEVAAALAAQRPAPEARTVLFLDELEQAHRMLMARVAADDGHALRALVDACGASLRLVLAYAPESYHAVGDADRGRLVYLPVPALDVRSIRESFGLSRGEANFVWWVSRGRARGAVQAVRSIIEPHRRGAFDRNLEDLGAALDALPGVFGVRAILRDRLSHAEARALLDLRPRPSEAGARGVVCSLADERRLADRVHAELRRRVAADVELGPVANELVSLLAATADDDERAFVTLEDFRAALRAAEARAIESGRQPEPIDHFVEHALLAFDALGELGTLERRLPVPLATLSEERFPSPFTDPYLPIDGPRAPSEVELNQRARELERVEGPLLTSAANDFAVFASEVALARWLDGGALDDDRDPVRAVVLDACRTAPRAIELARQAGRLRLVEVSAFHATFLRCLALRARASPCSGGADLDALVSDPRVDRQLARKITWHLERVTLQLGAHKPRPEPAWSAALRFVRDERLRSALGRLKPESPALLALLLPIRGATPPDRRLLARIARLCDAKEPLRRIARTVNPGGRLSGAGVVVDELLPLGVDPPRWTERDTPGAAELARLLDAFAGDATHRARLARWLLPDDAARLTSLFAFDAGAPPDVAVEETQLEALQGLERTARAADAIVADLVACTGRPRESLGALRLAHVVDQVRVSTAAVEELRALGAELSLAVPDRAPWVRALGAWLCGVFADRLLKGVEKEQSALGAWTAAGAAARDTGARALEVERAFREVGATACCEAVQVGRRRLANHLDGRELFERELRVFRGTLASLEGLATSLRAAVDALAERGISLTADLAGYLPDDDGVGADQRLFRALPGVLEELAGPLPATGGRGAVAYVELVGRLAETSRRVRLRERLEGLLDLVVPPDLRLDEETVAAIERTWSALTELQRARLSPQLRTAVLRSADDLERWLEHAAHKDLLTAGWAGAPLVADLDARVAAWAGRLDVPLERARELDGHRATALRRLAALPTSLRPEVSAALASAARSVDVERAYAALADDAQRLGEELATRFERLRALGAPSPPAIDGCNPDDVLAGLDRALADVGLRRARALDRTRELGDALVRLGERAQAVPAELGLAQAERLEAREAERLAAAIGRAHAELAAWLEGVGVAAALAPQPCSDLLAWAAALEAAGLWRARVTRQLDTLASLGVRVPAGGSEGLRRPGSGSTAGLPSDWEALEVGLGELVQAGLARRRELALRHERVAGRARRLGGAPAVLPADLPLDEFEGIVARIESEVVTLRTARLVGCSDEARATYASVLAQDGEGLAPPLAELVALGLLRTVEEA